MCSRGVFVLENRGVLEEIKRYNLTDGKRRSKRKYNFVIRKIDPRGKISEILLFLLLANGGVLMEVS